MNRDLRKRPAPAPGHNRFLNWLDRRTGIDSLLREALDEPIPGGARLAYIFGSGLLFIFLSQVITGIFLALYYVPSADHAHTTVAYITKVVAAGSFLRSLHVYGASAMVIIVLLHLGQTFLYGSYKGRREILWISGTILFLLVMGMAFTGYLLPWDAKAYFATSVGTNVPSEIPLVGNDIKEVMRGGTELGTLTVSRFFVAHVFMIPGLIFLFIAIHIYLFRKAGAAGPTNENPVRPQLATGSFYPKQVLVDLGFTLLVITILGFLAYRFPASLGPPANPADTQYLPRPEWYYRPLFEWLKYWHGPAALVGILLIPTIIGVLFVGTPFLDRGLERRPWRRPVAVGLFSLVFLGLIGLGATSYYDDAHQPEIARQLALQDRQTLEFMHEPFKPTIEGVIPVGTAASAAAGGSSPLVSRGEKIFESHSCYACHGQGGAGGPIGPRLMGIGAKYTPDQLLNLFNHPTAAMKNGGMPHFRFSLNEVKTLEAYLDRQP